MINELIAMLSEGCFAVSLDFRESIRNWKLVFPSSIFLYKLACNPNSCTDEIDIRPCVSGNKSIFADTREAFNIKDPCWSLIERLSMIRRFKKPRSTRSILASVPNFWAMESLIWAAMKHCTGGRCVSKISNRYSPVRDHIIPNIMCLNFLNSKNTRYKNTLISSQQKINK